MKANVSERSDAAQAPAAAMAEFLSGLAHNMRSPLGVVAQALAEVRADLAPALTDEHRLLLSLADRGMLRLGRISDAVSLVAAMDGGDFEIRRAPVDLVALLDASVAAASAIEPRREVKIACDLPEASCPCDADADRLTRAISEVVINAIRHARQRVRVTLELARGTARASIEDDGPGVAADRRATLFQRFAPRMSRAGLGIGLSIAHDIIEAHGGGLSVEESTLPPGRPGTIGARFVMSLPIHGDA